MSERDALIFQTQTLASLSAQVQGWRETAHRHQGRGDPSPDADGRQDGLMVTALDNLHESQTINLRKTLSDLDETIVETTKLPPLPDVFPPGGINFADVVNGTLDPARDLRDVLRASLQRTGTPIAEPHPDPVLSWYRPAKRDATAQTDPAIGLDVETFVDGVSLGPTVPGTPQRASELFPEDRPISRPQSATYLIGADRGSAKVARQVAELEEEMRALGGRARGGGARLGDAPEVAAAVGTSGRPPQPPRPQSGRPASSRSRSRPGSAMRLSEAIMSDQSAQSTSGGGSDVGVSQQHPGGGGPPDLASRTLMETRDAYERKFRDLQAELVHAETKASLLQSELESIETMHQTMLEDQKRAAEELGLENPLLGDPVLLLRAKELYEHRIITLRESESQLLADKHRLKKERHEVEDELQALRRKTKTEIYAREELIKRMENVRDTMKAEAEHLHNNIAGLKRDLEDRDDTIKFMKDKLNLKDKEIVAGEMERMALRDALEEFRTRAEKAESLAESAKAESLQAVAEWKEKLDKMLSEFSADMEEFGHMKETFAKLQAETAAVQNLFEKEAHAHARVRFKLGGKDTIAKLLKEQLESSKKAHAVAEERLVVLDARLVKRDEVIVNLQKDADEKVRLDSLLELERSRHARVKTDLTEQSKRFEDECERLGAMMRVDHVELKKSQEAQERAKVEMEMWRQRYEEAAGRAKVLQEELRNSNFKVMNLEDTVLQSKGDQHASQKQVQVFEVENNRLRDNLETTQLSLEEHHEKYDALKEEQVLLTAAHEDLIKSSTSTQNLLESRINDLQNVLEQEQEAKARLNLRVKELEPLVEELRVTKECLDTTSEALAKLKTSMESVGTELIEKSERLETLLASEASLKEQVADLTQKRNLLRTQSERLTVQVDDLSRDVGSLESQLKTLEAQHKDTCYELRKIEGEHAALQNTHEETLGVLEEWKNKYAHLEETTSLELANMRTEVIEMKKERDYVRKLDSSKNALIQGLKTKLSKPLEIPEVAEAITTIRDLLAEETKARMFREKYASALAASNSVLEKRIDKTQRTLDESRIKNRDLESSLAELRVQITGLQDALVQARMKKEDVEDGAGIAPVVMMSASVQVNIGGRIGNDGPVTTANRSVQCVPVDLWTVEYQVAQEAPEEAIESMFPDKPGVAWGTLKGEAGLGLGMTTSKPGTAASTTADRSAWGRTSVLGLEGGGGHHPQKTGTTANAKNGPSEVAPPFVSGTDWVDDVLIEADAAAQISRGDDWAAEDADEEAGKDKAKAGGEKSSHAHAHDPKGRKLTKDGDPVALNFSEALGVKHMLRIAVGADKVQGVTFESSETGLPWDAEESAGLAELGLRAALVADSHGAPRNGNFTGVQVREMTARSTLVVIYDIYREKVQADLAAARNRCPPMTLRAFVAQLFALRYSLRSLARDRLRTFGHNVRRWMSLAPVARFGTALGLVRDGEAPLSLVEVEEFPLTAGNLSRPLSTAKSHHTAKGGPGSSATARPMSGRRELAPLGPPPPSAAHAEAQRPHTAAEMATKTIVARPATQQGSSATTKHRHHDTVAAAPVTPLSLSMSMTQPPSKFAGGATFRPPTSAAPAWATAAQNPYAGLPLPVQWRALANPDEAAAHYFAPRKRPQHPPHCSHLVHPASVAQTRVVMNLPDFTTCLNHLGSQAFALRAGNMIDLGVPVTGRQVPQLYQMLMDVALVFHLDPSRLPRLFVRPTRSGACHYLRLPRFVDRANPRMPKVTVIDQGQGPRGPGRTGGLLATYPTPSGAAPLPFPGGAKLGAECSSESGRSAATSHATRARDGFGPSPVTPKDLYSEVPAEDFVHGIVISSGTLDLLQPSEIRAAIAGAILPYLISEQITREIATRSKKILNNDSAKSPLLADALRRVPSLATAAALADLAPDALNVALGDLSPEVVRTTHVPALAQWRRFWSLSEDRAAMVGAQDTATVVASLLKLATESWVLADELSTEAMLEVARNTDVMDYVGDPSTWTEHPSVLAGASNSLAVMRAREVDRFGASPEYLGIMRSAKVASLF